MDENTIVNYSTEKENTNFSSTSEENIRYKAWFLLVVYYLVFTIFNILLFLVIFKTSWPMPRFLQYILFNDVLYFTILSGIFLYIFFAATLVKIMSKLYVTDASPFPRLTSAKTMIAVIIGVFAIAFLGMKPTFGLTLWLIPALLVISVECLLFYFVSRLLIKLSSNMMAFAYVLSGLAVVLLIATFGIFLFYAPLTVCSGMMGVWGTGDYECISAQAKKSNNVKICEKTFSPSNPFDCYRYLAKTEDDPSYCEYIWETHKESKDICYMNVDGILSGKSEEEIRKRELVKNSEYQYAQSEYTTSLGIKVILDEWFWNHGGNYAGFNEDKNNFDKINKVLDKVKNKYGYGMEYFLDVRDQAFAVKTRAIDNGKRFWCVDSFIDTAQSRWRYIDISGDNFREKKNCQGESMDSYIEYKLDVRKQDVGMPLPFDKWYNQELGDAIYK